MRGGSEVRGLLWTALGLFGPRKDTSSESDAGADPPLRPNGNAALGVGPLRLARHKRATLMTARGDGTIESQLTFLCWDTMRYGVGIFSPLT